MKLVLPLIMLAFSVGCSDATDSSATTDGPTKSALPECDDEFFCSYEGLIAQAIHVDGQWTLAATDGRFVEAVDPVVGAGTRRIEGEYQNSLIDCTESERVRQDAYIDGPFDRYDFSETCQRLTVGDTSSAVSFGLEVDGTEFVEQYDVPTPPSVTVEQLGSQYYVRNENADGLWIAYVVEDQPGVDGTTYFKTIRGDESYTEVSVDPEEFDGPFSVFAVGTSGGASLITSGDEEFAHGLAIENWERVGGGTP